MSMNGNQQDQLSTNYPRHILSKSTFLYGLQCPKRLYFHKFKPELYPEVSEQQQAIFAKGTDIGLLAQGLFPKGIDASPKDAYSYQESVLMTQKYLLTNDVIYEAAFQYEGVLCAIDILVRKDDKWYAFEVKGANSAKQQFKLDAALQYYVISKTGLPLADISIIHFDRDYVRFDEIDIQKLFMATSVLDEVIDKQEFIETNIQALKQLIHLKQEPIIEPGDQCCTPYECPFMNHCWKDIEIPEVEIPDGEIQIDKENVQQYLNDLQYPLHFFDFETVMYGVPEFKQSSPYQQIPFQYSLHILHGENTDVNHKAFLGDGVNDPRPALIEQMIYELGKEGAIIVWNQTFEISCIRRLIVNFPEYEDALNEIINRIVDLMSPFKKRWISIPACNGSASLKVVLPVLVPELSYEELEIQEGMTASFVYSQLKHKDNETVKTEREYLFEYCKLDTLAMVKILEKVKAMLTM